MPCFNTQPHEGGCMTALTSSTSNWSFNTQPHEGGCFKPKYRSTLTFCFNTQPHEGGCVSEANLALSTEVSTHSRTKAAALVHADNPAFAKSFNTQPHEGGCFSALVRITLSPQFQHTAARRRLLIDEAAFHEDLAVSTHSRTKAAARFASLQYCTPLGFNTQPHEGGCVPNMDTKYNEVEFQHTAARRRLQDKGFTHYKTDPVSTHSRTKAAALSCLIICIVQHLFQHTAARRRLPKPVIEIRQHHIVSTHSRTKAAANVDGDTFHYFIVSTHSRTKAAACAERAR